jgi:hypothetical protein
MSATVYIHDHELNKIIDSIVKDGINNRADVVECIASLIKKGYSNPEVLVKCILGVLDEPIFVPGDIVYVRIEGLYLGSYDPDLTNDAGNMIEDKTYVKAIIVNVDKFSSQCYHVELQTISTNGNLDKRSAHVNQNQLHLVMFMPAPRRINVGDIL